MTAYASIGRQMGVAGWFGKSVKRRAAYMLRRAVLRYASALPFEAALDLSGDILRQRGFGGGTDVTTSGEEHVFALIGRTSPVLVDGGAFRGGYLSAFLRRHQHGKVIAIEPSREHFEILSSAVVDKPVTLINCALGSVPGQATLYKDASVSCIASLSQRRLNHFGLSMPLTETVEVSDLDSLLAGVDYVDLLKLDIEGHELAALQGATASLATGKIGMVQFEFGGCNLDTRTTLQDFYYFFAEYGYELSIISPAEITPLGRYREAYEQYTTTNYLARRTRRKQ